MLNASVPSLQPLPLRSALALSALSGLLFVPGFPPVGWWPCTLVAFAPLYRALAGQTPARALLLGWTSLFLSSTLVFSWLVGTLRAFGGLPLPLAILGLLLLSAWHGLRLGLATALAVRAEGRGWPAAPTFAVSVLALEWLFPLIFTWNLATAMGDNGALLQSAELGGPLLVDLLILGPSLALGELWRSRAEGRSPSAAVVGVALMLPALAAGWGVIRMGQIAERQAGAPELRVGLVQPNVRTGGDAAVSDLQASTRALAAAGAELVVWPETAIHTSYNDLTYQKTIPEQVTGSLGIPTIFGVRTWRLGATEGAPKVRHNSVMLAARDGSILGRYDKHRLLVFGEYTPFSEILPAWASGLVRGGRYTPGVGPQPLEWDGHRVQALVCYEDILAGFVNEQVAASQPDLLVNLTNDAWFGDSAEPWIHQAEARLRAIEHRRFLVRATNSGPSGVVDATGTATQLGGLFVAEDRIVHVRLLQGGTLYERVGDAVGWISSLVVALLLLLRPREHR